MNPEKFTNDLIHESSPYLLQHAHNPVNWIPWSDKVYEIAKAENKLILVSVGYSSCHWCHVMEHECFENEEVAELMNRHFVCVKVDREERPDIDQIYMLAVQLMTQRGGWPLNCFTLPDGRPIYGGTYFPKDQWTYILNSLHHTWTNDKQKAIEYAENLHEGINQQEWLNVPNGTQDFSSEKLHEMVVRWSRNFDNIEGGYNHAPKFPMPNNYLFLLRYGFQMEDSKVLKHVEITLDKMAMGGIYDQIGGGFSRYSVDALWKVPHFEKMLYDNGQLLSLYAQGYKVFKKELYKEIIDQTVVWLDREMLHPEGSYYSALDADSEGEEGKFYTWSKEELEKITGPEFSWISEYYNLNHEGYWEHGKYILLRRESDLAFCQRKNWPLEELVLRRNKIQKQLLEEREQRIRPGLDDKNLTSWNALLMTGLIDAYTATEDRSLLERALGIADWIERYQMRGDRLFRTRKNSHSKIDGFLEDYACVIEGFISLYEATFETRWLELSTKLLNHCMQEFYDEKSNLFFFTEKNSQLISRKLEVNDNVIPASNSIMANNLFRLGKLFHQEEWLEISKKMLSKVYDGMEKYGSNYSNWGRLLMNHTNPFYEVVISGTTWEIEAQKLSKQYHPNLLIAAGIEEKLPMMHGKIKSQQITFSICSDQACYAPVSTMNEALQQLSQQ